MTIREKLIL